MRSSLSVMIALFIGSARSLPFEAVYSAFSGVVAEIPIGAPAQNIRVSLGFGMEPTFLYDESVCPGFVGDCFIPANSQTFQETRIVNFVNMGLGWSAHRMGNDSIGGDVVEFFVADSSDPLTIERREAAGVISAGRSSALMQGKSVAFLRHTTDSNRFLIDTLHVPLVEADSVPMIDGPEFAFQAQLGINGSHHGETHVVFDPTVSSVVLPASLRDDFDLNARGEVIVGCEDSFSLDISLGTGVTISVRMGPLQVEIGCIIRAVIGNSETLIIGKHLIRSVDGVMIDNVNGRIQLVPPVAPVEWEEVIPNSLVPIFVFPEVDDSDDTIDVIFEPSVTNAGLILAWEHPSVDGDVTLWRFIRTQINSTIGEDETRLVGNGGAYVQADFLVSGYDGSLRLHLLPSEHPPQCMTYIDSAPLWVDVRIVNLTPLEGIDLSIGEVIDLALEFDNLQPLGPVAFEDLDLPSPERVEATIEPEEAIVESKESEEDARDCAVCLEAFVVGQFSQALRNCTHKFHLGCIREWLSRQHLNCPSCREPVSVRDTESDTSSNNDI